MSKYTTELRYPLQAGLDIGLNSYEIFNESYRETLNTKIINHFYFREIGFPTWERFKFALNNKMREIMPYYNRLYQLQFDELILNKDITITEDNEFTGNDRTGANTSTTSDVNTTNSATNTNTSNEKTITSDTPMGKLGDIFSQEYATATNQNTNNITDKDDFTGTSHNTGNTLSTADKNFSHNEDKHYTRRGYEGTLTKGELIIKYKDIFFNIDMLIINELEPLFMGVW